MNIIDDKINKLLSITSNFIFPEYYSHENKIMWKILNEFTHYNEEKIVLCGVDEGIEKALDIAIKALSIRKSKFYSE